MRTRRIPPPLAPQEKQPPADRKASSHDTIKHSPPEKLSSKQQFNVYLPPELIRRIKYRALDDQLSLSDLVEKALERYLQTGDRKCLTP